MATHKPLITISIPTHNRANYITETLDSVLAQTYKNIEVLICNDGSTDNTGEIVKSYKDKRIRYEKNIKNLGYIKTMNKNTKLAKGEWIMHLSDDDRMRPTMLEEMVKTLEENKDKKIGFVVPQSVSINSVGKVVSTPPSQLGGVKYLVLQPKEFIYNFTLYGRNIRNKYRFNTSFPSTLFSRAILQKMGGSSEDVPVSHDVFVESKICLQYPIIVIDEPLFEYRVHENWGASLNTKGEFLNEYLRFLKLLFAYVDKNNIMFDYDFKQYCYDSLINYLFAINGGLLRLAARYRGSLKDRLKISTSYVQFGIAKRKRLLITPKFYVSVGASLLPQRLILSVGRAMKVV